MAAAEQGERPNDAGPVVVGVDGSECSRAALAWAFEQAKRRHCPLVALITWEWPATYGYAPIWQENVSFEEDARQTLEETVEQTLGSAAKDEMTLQVVHGHPAAVLEARSETASLIVVGTRGHRELAGMLLGSVSEHLTAHAHCPVVVVRGASAEHRAAPEVRAAS